MSLVQVALILVTVFALSVGQVLFKIAAQHLPSFANWTLGALVLDRALITGLVLYAVSTVVWLLVLRITPLRLAYPFAALAFVLVPILSHLWIGEPLRIPTFIGAAIICIGVWVSVASG